MAEPLQFTDLIEDLERGCANTIACARGECLMCRSVREIKRLRKQVIGYEDGITWQTNCLNCAQLMNKNYSQYVEIERLRKNENGS